MGEFFRGWRRKIGVVTLVMASVLTVGWTRSLTLHDCVDWNGTPWRYLAESCFGRLHFSSTCHLDYASKFNCFSAKPQGFIGYRQDANGTQSYNPIDFCKCFWRWDFSGFQIA